MSSILTGLDRLVAGETRLPLSGRVALLCNSTTVDRSFVPSAEALASVPGIRLIRILSPQHGFGSEKQDNMIESPNARHPALGIEIFSLYSATRSPSDQALADIDAIVIDLQDIGTRVYTFMSTALLTLAKAVKWNLPVIVLDRPNPIGGTREGPILEQRWRSFVGMLDIPLRHGLTLGEICLYSALQQNWIDPPDISTAPAFETIRADYRSGGGFLAILPTTGWSRKLYYNDTGLPWTMPSPNMPTLETAVVYPGLVALEGTNLSEGRGTTRPFELFGAPYLDPAAVIQKLHAERLVSLPALSGVARGGDGTALAGALLRQVSFETTFQKHAGAFSRGFQLHVVDRSIFRPVAASVALLWAIRHTHPREFAWRQPPYEYEEKLLPIDLIFGTDRVRVALDAALTVDAITGTWGDGLSAFAERLEPCGIYGH